MQNASAPFLVRLRQAALDAEAAEAEFRRSYVERLQALEKTRVRANRRLAFLDAMTAALGALGEGEPAAPVVARVLGEEVSLHAQEAAHQPIIEAFRPVADAISAALDDETPEAQQAVLSAMVSFERWYAERTGALFLDLYDVYRPETPVVDF